MSEIDRILEELIDYVQEMRESGNTDLRIVLHQLRLFKSNNSYTLKEEND